MVRVQLALVPATLYGFWLFGWPSFFLWLLIWWCRAPRLRGAMALRMTGSTRAQDAVRRLALLTGWLLAMTLPPWRPWWWRWWAASSPS